MNDAREIARSVLAQAKRAFSGRPSTIVPADAREFTHLDLENYDRFQKELERAGYRLLGDVEILEVSNSPGTVMARTMVRAMVSGDGTVLACMYQVKPRMLRLLRGLLVGILNLRLIDAPKNFLNHRTTKDFFDFESEIGQAILVTTNTAQANVFSQPKTIDSLAVAREIPLQEIRVTHERRVASAQVLEQTAPTRISSLADANALSARIKTRKDAHRAAVNWVTRDELVKLAYGNEMLADMIYTEVQAILGEERARA